MTRDMRQQIDPEWAWAPYQPDDDRPWDLPRAGHLFRRAAFGASWAQLQQALVDGPARTIDRLLQPDEGTAGFQQTYDDFDASADGSDSAESLRAWWLRRMLLTPDPLRERMTCFWHNHFAISNARVRSSTMMRHHLLLLRKHALGDFATMLQQITQDSATLVGVDCVANRRAQPNANFAEALLEHYTVGPDHYQAADVQEAARALTGWFVTRGQTRLVTRERDTGRKTILGQEGDFAAADLVQILLAHPATAQTLIRKLDRWLITETEPPGDGLLQPLVERLRQNYDLRPVVETMLRSNRFFSSVHYRGRIKSPVEFAVGFARSLEVLVPTGQLGDDLAHLGENLLHPPTLAGWAGGTQWINPATLIGRRQLVEALLTGREPYGERVQLADLAARYGRSAPAQSERFLLDLFLQADLPANVRRAIEHHSSQAEATSPDVSLNQWAIQLTCLPEFQLS